jgi:hypothetical protein
MAIVTGQPALAADVNNAINARLALAGGILTGPVAMNAPGSDPINVNVPSGFYSRIRYTVAGARTWSAGCDNTGTLAIADETAGSYRFTIGGAGGNHHHIGGSTLCDNNVNAAYNQVSDFYLGRSGNLRLLNWAANWYDCWRESDGMRIWSMNGNWYATLDGSGNLWCQGNISTPNSLVGGWIHSTGSLQIDGGAQVNGTVNANSNLTCGGTVQGGYVHSTGNGQIDGQLIANGGCQSNGSQGVYFSAVGHWFMASVDGNGTTYLYVDGRNWCYITANTSDARIKNVVGPHQRGLADINRLRVMDYTWKGNDDDPSAAEKVSPAPDLPPRDTTTVHPGIMAQDVEEFWPELVARRQGHIDGNAVDDLRYLRLEQLNFALINAVQELTARVAALEAR